MRQFFKKKNKVLNPVMVRNMFVASKLDLKNQYLILNHFKQWTKQFLI